MKINWFPGHMKKTIDELADKIKLADVVLYVLDSRAPKSTLNPKFDKIIGSKPIIFVLNKSDFVSEENLKSFANKLIDFSKTSDSVNGAFFDIKMQGVDGRNPVDNDSLQTMFFEDYKQEQAFILEKIKKLLSIKILEYILSIQKREIQNTEVNILVRESSNINSYIIEEIAKNALNVKIISNNIYKFKKIEEKLYDEYGIAIQFSNSYKKSLSKSNIIINLDFDEIDLNEYLIYDRAIIINCINQNIKIKSKLFNGVVINSVNISFNQELKDKFKTLGLYNDFSSLILLASVLEQENYKTDINNYLVKIKNIYGNNGQISKNELKLYLTKK